MKQEQIDEIHEFQSSLSKIDEWVYWNICALEPPVTFERKYEIMKQWDKIKESDNEPDAI